MKLIFTKAYFSSQIYMKPNLAPLLFMSNHYNIPLITLTLWHKKNVLINTNVKKKDVILSNGQV